MFSVMLAAWLMFCGRIPAALSSRNKDFVCRARCEVAPDAAAPAIGLQFTIYILPFLTRGERSQEAAGI